MPIYEEENNRLKIHLYQRPIPVTEGPAEAMSSLSNYPPETHGGTVTSWVPVGTAYPSSSGCESLFWSVVQGTLAAWDPGYGLSVDTNVKCVPPAETTWWNQVRLGVNTLTRLSLGPITCPSAYSTVTTSIGTNTSSTFVACCPPYVKD
jgi:hypothetical protein